MKLYEITNDMKGLQELADNGEITAEDIQDTMDGLDIAFDRKAEAVLMVRREMLANVVTIEKEIERLMALKSPIENSAGRLDDYLKGGMISAKKDKLDLNLFKVTLKKASVKLGDIDETKIPGIFWTVIPETKKLDKRSLLKAAKAAPKEAPMEGVELTESSRALLIK